MKSYKKVVFAITTCVVALSAKINYPFPQDINFIGCIKPNNRTQAQLDSAVTSLFDDYKSMYLKKYGDNQYYIKADGEGEGGNSSLTVSEAHGYGMMILALMAGYDDSAQIEFDGMYRFFEDNPSTQNDNLMSWLGDIQDDAATDGDMDVAYALLLADKQWESDGDINYYEEAKRIITDGIKEDEFSEYTYRSMLGDWDDDDYTTRTSDWMPAHLKAYKYATGDVFWDNAVDTIYSMIDTLVTKYSPQTGLLPDFVTGRSVHPDSEAGGTGEENGDIYSWNACRDPWRIAMDYAHYRNPKAKEFTDRISNWLKNETNEDPGNISSGYYLDGDATGEEGNVSFIAPFTVGLITDSSNQDFLNKMWDWIEGEDGGDVYAHALNLLSQLLITGNWWSPTGSTPITAISNTYSKISTVSFSVKNTQLLINGINKNGLVEIYSISGKKLFSQKLNNNKNIVTLPQLSKGIKILKIMNDKVPLITKLSF